MHLVIRRAARTTPPRAAAAALALVLALSACGDPGTVDLGGPGDGTDPADTPAATTDGDAAQLAWTYHGVVESTLEDQAAARIVEDADTLAAAWAEHGFDGDPPSPSFDDEVVLLLGLPDDACPDEPIDLRVTDGRLEVEWLSPPGGCNEPLILWLHALTVHRGLLAESFAYGPDAPFEDTLTEVTLTLPPYGGGPPPPAPEPPAAITDAQLDAVFADHPVERCGPEHSPWRAPDPDAPIDEATGNPPDVMAAIDASVEALTGAGWDLESETIPLIDRSDGVRAVVVTGEEDRAEVQALLDAEVGAGEVDVEVGPWPPTDVADAFRTLTEEMGELPGGAQLVGASGPPGPATLSTIDPTRETLDHIASLVDPALVCVEVQRSGVVAGDGG